MKPAHATRVVEAESKTSDYLGCEVSGQLAPFYRKDGKGAAVRLLNVMCPAGNHAVKGSR